MSESYEEFVKKVERNHELVKKITRDIKNYDATNGLESPVLLEGRQEHKILVGLVGEILKELKDSYDGNGNIEALVSATNSHDGLTISIREFDVDELGKGCGWHLYSIETNEKTAEVRISHTCPDNLKYLRNIINDNHKSEELVLKKKYLRNGALAGKISAEEYIKRNDDFAKETQEICG